MNDINRRTFVKSLTRGILGTAALLGISKEVFSESFNGLNSLVSEDESENFWELVRVQFLLNPKLIYMNNGSLGTCPRIVLDSTLTFWRQLESNPATIGFGPFGAKMNEVREKAAEFLGAETDEIILTRNTTEGMNLVATGLYMSDELKKGDEVISTDHEHPGGYLCWEYLEKQVGIKRKNIKLPVPLEDVNQILEILADAITPKTKVISISHVTFTTGTRLPIRKIADLARPKGILLVVDGAQVPGAIRVDVKDLQCDTYASSSHKWMLAPKGSGLLYIRKEIQDRIKPVFLHCGYSAYTGSTGVRNIPCILGHGVAMDFHQLIGINKIQRRVLNLNRYLKEKLQDLPNATLVTPMDDQLSSGMTSIVLEKYDCAQFRALMEEKYNIIVKAVPQQWINAVRISTHIYNNYDEIDRLISAFKRELV